MKTPDPSNANGGVVVRPSIVVTPDKLPSILRALRADCRREWISKADIANALENIIEAIAAAPPSPGAGLSEDDEAAKALVALVEGPGCIRWQDASGFRLKDTKEWCAFYVATKRLARRLGATNAEAVGADGDEPWPSVQEAMAAAETYATRPLSNSEQVAIALAAEVRRLTPPTGTRGVSEADFDSWWGASKYRQVIFAGPTHRQIAKDAWDAALSSATSGGEHG